MLVNLSFVTGSLDRVEGHRSEWQKSNQDVWNSTDNSMMTKCRIHHDDIFFLDLSTHPKSLQYS